MPTVLIVGAGPTGLTLACELARRGVAVRVIDKSAECQKGSRGKTLNARSLEVLDALGVGDRIRAAGITRLPFRKYFEGELVEETDPFGDRAVFVPQWWTEEVLRSRLADHGVRVEWGTELTGFTETDAGLLVALAGRGQIEAEYLVGSDGGRSRVRKLLGVAFEGETAQEQAMVCGDVVVDGLVDEAWHQWFSEDGAVLLSPFRGTTSWQFQASPERDAAGEILPPSLESFQRLFDRHARLPGVRLRDLTWRSDRSRRSRTARHLRGGAAPDRGVDARPHQRASARRPRRCQGPRCGHGRRLGASPSSGSLREPSGVCENSPRHGRPSWRVISSRPAPTAGASTRPRGRPSMPTRTPLFWSGRTRTSR